MTPAAFQAWAGVSRETLGAFEAYATLLARWNARINLVAPRSLEAVWTRHFQDSVQVWQAAPALAPGARWVDLGSGAGFPGLVVALMARDAGHDLAVQLIESDARKAAFLREAARAIGVSVEVVLARIEAAPPAHGAVVSARALAPLPKLLGYVERHGTAAGVALLLKGQDYRSELTAAAADWHMEAEARPSVTDPAAALLVIRQLERRR
ncbi:MAG: 16S rRNA (guanine(527)-N(7))-methyltransferase RsmG [Pseudomonadota bacterium]